MCANWTIVLLSVVSIRQHKAQTGHKTCVVLRRRADVSVCVVINNNETHPRYRNLLPIRQDSYIPMAFDRCHAGSRAMVSTGHSEHLASRPSTCAQRHIGNMVIAYQSSAIVSGIIEHVILGHVETTKVQRPLLCWQPRRHIHWRSDWWFSKNAPLRTLVQYHTEWWQAICLS